MGGPGERRSTADSGKRGQLMLTLTEAVWRWGRPDSDARPPLTDSSLSQSCEPDPWVLRAEGEGSCKQSHGSVTVTLLYLIGLRLTSVRPTPGRSALITSYQLVLPWDREATPDRERWEDTHWV
ncbi:unnamed protein product, partial [Coregonus sp. 'balchen']